MKNNFVAKHAQRSGAGFHKEKSKPEPFYKEEVYKCSDCNGLSTVYTEDELICEHCESNSLTPVN